MPRKPQLQRFLRVCIFGVPNRKHFQISVVSYSHMSHNWICAMSSLMYKSRHIYDRIRVYFRGKQELSEGLSDKKRVVGPRSECRQVYRLCFSMFIYRHWGFGTVSVITARFSNSAMWWRVYQPLIWVGWRACSVCTWVCVCVCVCVRERLTGLPLRPFLFSVFYSLKHRQMFHGTPPCFLFNKSSEDPC